MSTPDNKSLEAANKRGGILLVEDDPPVRVSLGLALESEEYHVTMTGNGAEALRRLQEGGIDLVLLDLNLPVTSGWDVFERMTAITPFLPIIIITARADQYELAATAGATAIMEKPLCLPVLVATIDRLLHEGFENRVQRILGNRPLVLAGSV
jgi:two-component system, response regulator, stage 0 sporulation protein F